MKLRLLEYLSCPGCSNAVTLTDAAVVRTPMRVVPGTKCSGLCSAGGPLGEGECADCGSLEVMAGRLTCKCGHVFDVRGGVPQLLLDSFRADEQKERTAESFGFLWSRTTDGTSHSGAHFAGTHAAFERTLRLPNAHIVRADLCRLPFRPSVFAFIYSYGVLHHLPVPLQGFTELARVSQPNARAAIYLYEDFSERATVLRFGLRAANVWRGLTTRLPHALLYALCSAAAPVVYLIFTVPYRILVRVPACRTVAAGIPFRHGRGPFSLTGDLYDRFSAPVEHRYSRQTAAQLVMAAGFSVRQVQ